MAFFDNAEFGLNSVLLENSEDLKLPPHFVFQEMAHRKNQSSSHDLDKIHRCHPLPFTYE